MHAHTHAYTHAQLQGNEWPACTLLTSFAPLALSTTIESTTTSLAAVDKAPNIMAATAPPGLFTTVAKATQEEAPAIWFCLHCKGDSLCSGEGFCLFWRGEGLGGGNQGDAEGYE